MSLVYRPRSTRPSLSPARPIDRRGCDLGLRRSQHWPATALPRPRSAGRWLPPAIAGRSLPTSLPSLLALAAALSAPVRADPGPVSRLEAGRLELGELRVTATRSERDPFWMADSISVVGREAIQVEQPTRLGDLLRDLPNVAVGGGPRGVGQTVNIRGLGDERIVFLLDGARQNFQRGHNARVFLDPSLLRQVEVLRGPASALWGSGALGGVVAMTTVDAADLLRPGERAGGRVRVGHQGVDGQWQTGVSAFGLVGEQLDLLADISYRNAQDLRLGTGDTLDNSGFESVAGLGKATWAPAPGHRLGLTLQFFDEDGEVPSNPQTPGTADNLVDRATNQYNANLHWDFAPANNPWVDIAALVYVNQTDIDERRLVDQRKDNTKLTTWGLDLRNRARFDGPGPLVDWLANSLILGLDYYEDRAESTRDGAPRPSFPDATQAVFGIYLHNEMQIAERVTLVPGLRWDHFDSRADSRIAPSQSDSEFSPKVALTVALTDWLALVGGYNEAFRAPSLTQLFVSGTHFTCGPRCANLFVPNPDLLPERAHNWEAGLRLRHGGLWQAADRVQVSVNFFRNDVDDFIEQLVIFTMRPMPGNPGAGGVSRFDNVRRARLEGFEAALGYDAPRWFVGADYGRTRGNDRTTNRPLGGIPPDQWVVNAGLRVPGQDLAFGWRGRFVAAQDRVPTGVEPSSAYDLHDLFLTWHPPMVPQRALRLDLGIDNLMDRAYRPYLSVIDGPGRNLKATLAYTF